MKAASESAPTGLLPWPSQEGRTDREAPGFTTQSAMVGDAAALPWPQLTVQPKAATDAPAPDAPPVPTSEPLFTPNPVAKETLEAASKASPNDKIPEPSKQVSTPKPRETVVMPREDQIVVAKPTPRPPAVKAEPRDTAPGSYAMLSTPAPLSKKSFTKRYQEMLDKTRVEGRISNRGKAGVDAVATPFGRYWAQVKTAIGSGWNRYVNEQMTLIAPGTARVTFHLDRDGRARNVRVDSNTSNSSFANVCERAVRDAPIPPIPPDVAAKLRDGPLEYSLEFTFYTF
jgi:outer membrane biosynthesis protein TonB